MIVMPSNNTGRDVRQLAARFPSRVGNLISPGGWRKPVNGNYALDNGRFPVWAKGKKWCEKAFWQLIDRAAEHDTPPRWLAVPDVITDREATLREWDKWLPRLEPLGWPLALVVQDGMTRADVPASASVVFIGGTTGWKRSTLWQWCHTFQRVHVGRINTKRWIWQCDLAGAESCDGTGWTRGDVFQWSHLVDYLERIDAGMSLLQRELAFSGTFIRDDFKEPTDSELQAHATTLLLDRSNHVDFVKPRPPSPLAARPVGERGRLKWRQVYEPS